jgi:tetratricopeptide (TPR) repeat protein
VERPFGPDISRRQALADEALSIAESSGDDATVVRVLNSVSYGLQVPPLLEQSLARSADGLVRAERVGDPVLHFWAAWQRAGAAAAAGRIDEMDRCLGIMRSQAEQLDQPILNWVHSYAQALRAQIAGDNDRAEHWATEAFQVGTDSGEPDAQFFYGAQLATVIVQRGTVDELVPIVEPVFVDTPEIADAMAAFRARVYVEVGRIDDARHLLEEFAASGFELALDPNWLGGMVQYAEAAIACRDPEHARALFDRLEPCASQLPWYGIVAADPVSHFLGGLATVLGRYDEADAYFTQAAALNDRTGAKFFAARTNLCWGKTLAERNASGDPERARKLLTRAHAGAVAHGYANVERRAADALALLT